MATMKNKTKQTAPDPLQRGGKAYDAALEALSGAPVGLLEPGCIDAPRCRSGRALNGDRQHAAACPLATP